MNEYVPVTYEQLTPVPRIYQNMRARCIVAFKQLTIDKDYEDRLWVFALGYFNAWKDYRVNPLVYSPEWSAVEFADYCTEDV